MQIEVDDALIARARDIENMFPGKTTVECIINDAIRSYLQGIDEALWTESFDE